ncbi:PIN domain-containing protein [Haladaptatus sp. DFWS20]|uniref:PIN domain-containing protein n=1 Tax=Haladaptatus sp. DFWS20 TaxID=3403467 RepID=UPI003EC0791A
MNDAYVFDTEAIIAFLYGEPGHNVVADLLVDVEADAEGYLTEANASEVFYLVARFEGTDDDTPTAASLRTADRDIRALERRGLAIERTNWRFAGEVKADSHISLADANAVALAHDRDAMLIAGADDDFEELPIDVDVFRFRNHGV